MRRDIGGPPNNRFVGQGPCALPWVRGKPGRADVGIGPYGEHCMKCGEAGRRGRRPLRKRIMGCVGEGLSCPPLCQPTDGHCRARQSGHFLETGLLHPPLAALRRFPLPRATARVAPTKALVGADDPVRPVPVTQHFVGQGPCALPWVRGERNPPVTALPCQPPLGKGAYRDGGYGLPRSVCALASQ